MKEYLNGKPMLFSCTFNTHLFDVLATRDGIKLLWTSYEYGSRFATARNAAHESGTATTTATDRQVFL